MRACLLLLLAVLQDMSGGEAARILAVFPTVSRSHHIWNHALSRALAARGHHVLELSPFAETHYPPRLRHILLEDKSHHAPRVAPSLLERSNFSSAHQHADAFFQCCFQLCAGLLDSPGSKEVLAMRGQFDLLIMEVFGFECFLGFVPHFALPTVAVSAHGHTPWNCHQTGTPLMTASLPLEMFPYSTPMHFWERVRNTLLTAYMQVRRSLEYLPRHDTTARTVFGQQMPPLADIEQNFTLLILNSGPELDPPRALPPGVVEAGCLHCGPGKPLPKDIGEFLDGASSSGVVVFSLGSNVRSDAMSPEKLLALLSVFSQLPQRVLWKWESDTPPDQLMPTNVKLVRWLPQQDVLAHRHVRVFVSHAGRLSSQEAAYHGVPVLAVPVFGDQILNGHVAEEAGRGLSLPYAQLTRHALGEAMHALLHNHSYLSNARAHARRCRDQPSSPVDRAVFWVEYALRHEGAPHVRYSALRLSWVQLHLLDVAAVLLGAPLLLGLALCRARRALSSRSKVHSHSSSSGVRVKHTGPTAVD